MQDTIYFNTQACSLLPSMSAKIADSYTYLRSQETIKSMDTLEIPVTYKNKELSFKAHVVRFGYVSHIVVDLDGVEITIERDEEGNYRAVGNVEKMQDAKVDVDLIKAVITVLQLL